MTPTRVLSQPGRSVWPNRRERANEPMTNVPQIFASSSLRDRPWGPSRGIHPTWSARAFACVVAAAGLSSVVACGSAAKTAAGPAPSTQRSEKIEHEECDTSGAHVQAIDTNSDGRPDIHRVLHG